MQVLESDLARESWAYFTDVVECFFEGVNHAVKLLAKRFLPRDQALMHHGILDGFASYIRRMAMIDLANRAEELAPKPSKKRKAAKRKARMLKPIDPNDSSTWRNLRFDWKLPDQQRAASTRKEKSPRAIKPNFLPDVCDTLPLARKLETINRILRNPDAALRRLARKSFDQSRWIVQIAAPKRQTPIAAVNNIGIDILFRRRFPLLLEKSKIDPG